MPLFDELRKKLSSQWAGVNRYNPQTLSLLEDCLFAQLKENKFDLEVNLTILKLYQLNTNMFKPDVAAKVLLKCMMALPKSDVVLAKCLIDQANIDVDPVKVVLELSDLLEGCNFNKVWDLLNAHKDLIGEITGFADSIRRFICHVVSITYQNIAFTTLKSILGGLSDEQVKILCKKENWEINDGFVYVYNHEATVKSRNIEEKLDFGNIQDILRSVA